MALIETAKFPAAVATETDMQNWKNVVPSATGPTLNAGINNAVTSVVLAAGTGAQLPLDNFAVSIDDEILFVSSRSTDTLTCTRAYEGSTAASHLASAPVNQRVTAKAHNQVVSEVFAIETALGTSLTNVKTQANGATPSGTPNLTNTDVPYQQMTSATVLQNGNNISHRQYSFTKNLVCFGDSISTPGTSSGGTAISSGGTDGYTGLLHAVDFTGWYLNKGTSSDMAPDMCSKVFALGTSPYVMTNSYGTVQPPTITMMIGTNDATNKPNSTYQGIYKQASLSCMAFLGIPRLYQKWMQDAAVTKTGTWTADNTYLTGLGEKSNTNNDTLSFTVIGTGNPLLLIYKMTDGNAGTFQVSIDGSLATDLVTSATTLNCFAPATISTTNGATTTTALGRFTMAAGSHTISIKITSATSGSNVVSIQSAGTMPATSSVYALCPRILRFGVLRQVADANGTWVTNYDAQAAADVATLSGDGIPVTFVPVRSILVDADMFDTKHPNDGGHSKIYMAARPYIQGGGSNTFTEINIPFVSSPYNLATTDKLVLSTNTSELALGTGAGDSTGSMRMWNLKAGNSIQISDGAGNLTLVLAGSQEIDIARNKPIGWSESNSNVSTIQTYLGWYATGWVGTSTATGYADGLAGFAHKGWVMRSTDTSSTAYIVLTTDGLIRMTASGVRTVTLPSVAVQGGVGTNGQIFIIKDSNGNAATNNITVSVASAGTIDGASSKVINTNFGTLKVRYQSTGVYEIIP